MSRTVPNIDDVLAQSPKLNVAQGQEARTERGAAVSHEFWDWLMRQSNRRSPLGDLARDAKSERGARCCKPHFTSPDAAETHLAVTHGACGAARDVMTKAWRSYLRSSRARAACEGGDATE